MRSSTSRNRDSCSLFHSRSVQGGGRGNGIGQSVRNVETVDTSTLETRATVGLYTGKDNRGQQVEEVKVWLVAGRLW